MPELVPLVTHERIAGWARQLRPHATRWGARLIETRTGLELIQAVAGAGASVVVATVGDHPADDLLALHRALEASPSSLTLLIDPAGRSAVIGLAQELGVTVSWGSGVLPPEVLRLVERWIPLARERQEHAGWVEARPPGMNDDLDAWIRSL